MELYPGQIVIIAVGFLILVLLLLCMGKSLLDIKLLQHIEITVDQESQETDSQMFGQCYVSFIRTISLPTYENAITCQKVETPPPKYLELFFPRKTSPPLDPVLEV